VASVVIAVAGVRARALTSDGALAAVVVGTLTTGLGGYGHAATVVGFFVSSSTLSRARKRRSGSTTTIVEKGERRDARQVAANGAVAIALASASPMSASTLLPFVGAMAAVTGDTWSTEIGTLSGQSPRHILTGEIVPTGTSGGVTPAGTRGAVAGGAFIGCLALACRSFDSGFRSHPPARLLLAGLAAGTLGSLLDSVLGATIQERRWCPQCQVATERRMHACCEATIISGGVPGVDNDVVNFFASLGGAGIGWMLARVFSTRRSVQPAR
jgi:uncharacterized protein (TIGR00297 family)